MHVPGPFALPTALRRALRGVALSAALIAGLAPVSTIALPVASAPAPRVTVDFVDPDRFADIGRQRSDRERTTVALVSAFETLAAPRLKAAQSLDIQVLNVDLAGYLIPSTRPPGIDIRVRRIGVDPAVIAFRWTLRQDGQVLASGEEQVTHLATRGQTDRDPVSSLGLERSMLERWFDERFGRPADHLGNPLGSPPGTASGLRHHR